MVKRKKGRAVNGWLVLDKPIGMTSTQAVNTVKRLLDARKAGHAGTLDPLATGILPIAFGEATKTMNFAVDSSKSYRFTVKWGAETDTDDAEGVVIATGDGRPTIADIEDHLGGFVGEVAQVPPKYSAIKIDGQRAYDLAREGTEVELEARTVHIHELRLVDIPDTDHAVFEAHCGKGTYVRAIARDLGRLLGCRGHVVALRRTRVGPFSLDEAVPLSEIEAAAREDEAVAEGGTGGADQAALQYLQPVSSALRELDEMPMSPNDAGKLRRGQAVLLRGRDAPLLDGIAYATAKGELIALGEIQQGSFIPIRVFNLGG